MGAFFIAITQGIELEEVEPPVIIKLHSNIKKVFTDWKGVQELIMLKQRNLMTV